MNKNTRRLFFTPTVIISLSILALIVLAAAFAPLIAPCDPNKNDLASALQGPSAEHLLGTDATGRDLFSRLLYGARSTLLSALGIVAFSAVFGVTLGLFAGYLGGWFDQLTLRICDVIISFPSLLLAFVFVAAFGRNLGNSILAIGIIYIPMTAKLARSLTLTEKTKSYVDAAKTIGYSAPRILFREILPNAAPSLLAQLTLDIGYAILDLAAMSFLGLGVQPPTADWGAMLSDGQEILFYHPFSAICPGIAIAVTVIAINLLSDGVMRYIDPSHRKLPRLRRKRLAQLQKEATA